MPRHIFQLKITLVDVAPPVWRRVLVPGAFTLDRVHRVIQYAMGWQDCHLHSFDVDGHQYGEPDPDGEMEVRDELDHRLDAVVAKGARFRYTYDFGDWWEHELVVEDVLVAESGDRYPACVDGERACPPEDVGGAFGYAEFLAAVSDPGHHEHHRMREWIGRPFDPTGFDAARASTLLRRLT